MSDAHATLAAEARPDHVHVTPVKVYLAVYAALLVFTGLTVLVSWMNLGPFAIYVAMAVAIVKATLVGAIFMHLYHDEKFNTLIIMSSVLFLALFFGFTMIDLSTRGALVEEVDNFVQNPGLATGDAEAREAADSHSIDFEGGAPDHH